MPAASSVATYPYTVVCIYRDRQQGVETLHSQSRHKTLGAALRQAQRGELAWRKLIGSQFSPLSWIVIDVRNYERHIPSLSRSYGGSHGKRNQPYD